MGQYKGIMGGIDTMMASRFKPWHYSYNEDRVSLTDLVITSGRQALTMARCDWGVNKLSLAEFMPDNPGSEDFCLIMRDSQVLGVRGEGYTPIQNEALADMADAMLTVNEGSSIESAGALFDGKVVWVLVRLADGTVAFGKDGTEKHERYVLVSTSHDGSQSFAVRLTDVRVECMNTISMAWAKSKAEYTVKHTTNALSYVDEAKRGMQMALTNVHAMDAEIKRLLDTELDSFNFAVDFVPAVVGTRPEDAGRGQSMYDEKFASIMSFYEADHNEAIADTAWGAVNAINEYEEWGVKPRKNEVWEAQFKRLLTGSYDLTRKAMSLVTV